MPASLPVSSVSANFIVLSAKVRMKVLKTRSAGLSWEWGPAQVHEDGGDALAARLGAVVHRVPEEVVVRVILLPILRTTEHFTGYFFGTSMLFY